MQVTGSHFEIARERPSILRQSYRSVWAKRFGLHAANWKPKPPNRGNCPISVLTPSKAVYDGSGLLRYPPRRSGRTVFPYPAPQINDSLSDAKITICNCCYLSKLCFHVTFHLSRINVSLAQSINLTSNFPPIGMAMPYSGSLRWRFSTYYRYYLEALTTAVPLVDSGCPLSPIPLPHHIGSYLSAWL